MATFTFTEAQLKKAIEDALKSSVPSIVEKLTASQKTKGKTATKSAKPADDDDQDVDKMTPKQLESYIIKNGWKLPPPSKKNKRGGFPKADLLEIVKKNSAGTSSKSKSEEDKSDRGRSKSRSRKVIEPEFNSDLGVLVDEDGWVYSSEESKVYAKVDEEEVVPLTAADIKSLKTAKIEVLSDKPLSATKVKEQNEKTVEDQDVPVDSEEEGEGDYYSVDAEDVEPEEGDGEAEEVEENEDGEPTGVDEEAEDEISEFVDNREATAKEYETYLKVVNSGKVKAGDAAAISKASKLDKDLVQIIIDGANFYQNKFKDVYKKNAPKKTATPTPEPKKTAAAKQPVGKKMLSKKQ